MHKFSKGVIALLIALPIAMTGCAGNQSAGKSGTTVASSKKSVTKAKRKVEEKLYRIENEAGFVVQMQPKHIRDGIKEQYKIDVVKRGFMPFNIKLSNVSYDGKVRIEPEKMRLIDPDGNEYTPTDPTIVSSKSQRSYTEALAMGMAFGLIGAGVQAAVVMADNEKIHQRIVGSKFHATTVAQGESAQGNVYFAVPNEMFELDGWKLVARVDNPDHQTFELSQTLDGKIQYRGKKPLYMVKKELAKKRAQQAGK